MRIAVARALTTLSGMLRCFTAVLMCSLAWLVASCGKRPAEAGAVKTFPVRGVVKELRATSVIVAHDEIPGYMDAMTMPFNVKDSNAIAALKPGDNISFRLVVTEDKSWIENIVRASGSSARAASAGADKSVRVTSIGPTQNVSDPVVPPAAKTNTHPLRSYKFTNELGQAVALNDFKGTALAITFFFTRCPIPEFCPRLSKNFQQAQAQLKTMAGAPTNWHLLSVTIDPENDTPAALKNYGARYDYDPAHWSFLTGPKDKLTEFAKLSDVSFNWEGNFLNHNFRTLIIDPRGGLQMVFPIGGDISTSIVEELLKAMTNSPPTEPPGQ
jgi:protein SCO1